MKIRSAVTFILAAVISVVMATFCACLKIDDGGVKVTGVTLNKAQLTLAEGEKETLICTVEPENATNKNVRWSSDNEQVATVSDGEVTGISTGTANIKVVTLNGEFKAQCTVTVAAAPVAENKYDVRFYSDGNLLSSETQQVKEGEKAVSPKGVEKQGYTLKGWAVGSAAGEQFDFDTPIDKDLSLYAIWQENQQGGGQTPETDSPITYTYAGSECAAFEWTESNPASSEVKVQYKLSSASSYTDVDGQLIRAAAESGKARVDIVGLRGGEKYDFAITTSEGKIYTVTGMDISSYDRSGYAHFKYTSGVGAYNYDGTLKSNATVIYVNESNKNTVTATIKGKTYTGIVDILAHAKDDTSKPIAVRIIGTVGAATWTHIEEGAGAREAIKPEDVKGKLSGTNVLTAFGINKSKSVDITQAQLIEKGVNTLDTSKYAELKGLDSKMKYDASKDEFDSAWNNCIVQNAKNVTLEGIGEDARLFQWGITWKNCNSIEVRNLTFEDYTEDACSFEGGNTTANALDDFEYGNYWIHHNTFEEGVNYWDVCNEQDKHDGDGSTDFKGVKNVTLSYDVYNATHKTGLIGGGDTQMTANVTFHHNYYNGCVSRLPLARQANMHMYNNYYKGTTSTDISLRANAYAFVENCYFEGNNRPVELVKGSSGMGAAKLVGCVIDTSKIVHKDVPDNHLYVGNDRGASVTSENKFAKNFESDALLFYFANGKSDVTEMLTAAQTKEQIPLVAGVMKRTSGAGGGTIGGGETDPGTQGGTGGETDPGTQGGEGSGTQGEKQVMNGYVVFNNGAKIISSAKLVELPADSGITVTASKNGSDIESDIEYKGKNFECDNVKCEKGYKLNTGAQVVIRLAQKKKVTLCYYDYSSASNPNIAVNGVSYEKGAGTTDQYGTFYKVEVTFEANTDYTVTKGSSNSEVSLCYMLLADAA